MDAAYRAARAREITEDPLVREAIASAEKRDIEELLAVKGWSPLTRDRKRQAIIDRINTRRELTASLNMQIALGDQAGRKGFTAV
jgi:hypothetical protein